MSKIGTLQQVEGNIVCIDGIFYDASKVARFLPKEINIQVEYSVDDQNKIQYIKKISTTTKSRTTQSKSPVTPKAITRGSTTKDISIIKQVLFKSAVDILLSTDNNSTLSDALSKLDSIYNTLKEKYLQELQ